MELDGETLETVRDFILGGSKVPAEGDCSHEIKRCLLLGKKVMTNLDSILKNWDYFANKGPSSQGYGFLVVMYGCESWTIKKAEHQRIDAFELWYWRRLSRVPWTARRSNQAILKEINTDYSLEWVMMKLQYFGHLMWRADLVEKSLMLWNDWRQEEKGTTEDVLVGWQHWLNGHEFEQTPGGSEG